MRADIIIIGAGLAGLSAAAEIAAHTTAKVTLIEKKAIGSNNPTPMTFAPVLSRYGLQGCAIGKYNRFTFHSPLGNRSTHSFQSYPLIALSYTKACQILFDRAYATGCLEMRQAAALSMERLASGWKVRLNSGEGLEASLVIDASGRGLFTSRALNLPRPNRFSHCYGARLSHCDIPDAGEAFFLAPHESYGNGGGWLYPLEHGQASFGYAELSEHPQIPAKAMKERFERALEEWMPYAQWLRNAEIEHVEIGSIPIYPLRKLVYDGLMITGDAAGQATIWSCMGSEAALEAGQLSGQAATQALIRGDFSARGLQHYQKVWDERNRHIYRNNAWIAPVVWSMTGQEWNRQIPRVQQLTPEQMIERLRINWPVPTLPQAAFVRSYDLVGRARRGFVRQLRSWLGKRKASHDSPGGIKGD